MIVEWIFAAAAVAEPNEQRVLYRYTREDGCFVMADRMPEERAAFEYEVFEMGSHVLIRRVAAERTPPPRSNCAIGVKRKREFLDGDGTFEPVG